jgi:hypothetical protein
MKTRINQILMFTLFGFLLLAISVKAEGTEKRNASSHEAIVENNTESNAFEMVKEYWEDSVFSYAQDDTLDFEDWFISNPLLDDNFSSILGGPEKEVRSKLWKYYTESIVLN